MNSHDTQADRILQNNDLYLFRKGEFVVFVYSVPTSALTTLNVKKYDVIVLKLLKSLKSYKCFLSFNMFRFFINHLQTASGFFEVPDAP